MHILERLEKYNNGELIEGMDRTDLTQDAEKEIRRLRKALERIVDCEEGLDPQSYAEIVLMGR